MTDLGTLELAERHGLFLCVECGKCSAVCPMGNLFEDYRYETSPRGIIEHALLGLEFELTDDHLWPCLTCDLCTDRCPQGVRFRDFVLALRRRILDAGHREHAAFCRGCGAYLGPQHTAQHLERTLGEDEEDLLALCPRCRRRQCGARAKIIV
jgi:heterodisulfide reductase subunit C